MHLQPGYLGVVDWAIRAPPVFVPRATDGPL
jgi:hypothetical protein